MKGGDLNGAASAVYIGSFGALSEGKGLYNPIEKELIQGRNQVGIGIGSAARI